MVDLGHERADRVDHEAGPAAGGLDHLGGGPVGAQHQGGAGRDLGHVVDEDHPEGAELLDDQLVVDDLVVAVDGRLEDPDHPGERLDRLLHPGAEAPRLGQEDLVDAHSSRLPARSEPSGSRPSGPENRTKTEIAARRRR